MSKFKTALRYLKYLRKGKSKYFIHSPFVFEFVDEVLFNKHHFYAYDEVEKRRDLLLISDRKVNVTDFGGCFFVFYRVSGSSGSLKIRAVSGTHNVQIEYPSFQNHPKATSEHFRGTKSKAMKRTCKIMAKSVIKMMRVSKMPKIHSLTYSSGNRGF